MRSRFVVLLFYWVASVTVSVACEPDRSSPELSSSSSRDAAAAVAPLSVDELDVVAGIADGERDPAVVVIDGAEAECAGVLVSGDVVLTSSICVGPPGFPAEEIAVRPDVSSPPMAHGARILLSPTVPTVGAGLAIVFLDRPVVDALPTWIRTTPAVNGEHVRTVGFEQVDAASTKLLRDHLPVISGRLDDFVVGEPSCEKRAGAAAFDEGTEELVGIVLNVAPCTDPFSGATYARALPLRDFVENALATPTDLDAGWGDAGERLRGSKGKTFTDFRDACEAGADCSTGVCMDQQGDRSCSRSCGSGDRCPTTSRCKKAVDGDASMVTICADP